MYKQNLESRLQLVMLLIASIFSSTVMARSVHSIKLLSPQVGYAATSDEFSWTTDAGEHWERRTPPLAADEVIDDAFFLDESSGWLLLVRNEENDQFGFALASTSNGGRSWEVSRIDVPTDARREFTGRASVHFVDHQHGWVDLGVVSGSSFRPGQLIATSDGGLSWTISGQPGVFGSMCFFDRLDGVLIGGPGDTEAYVTHDGSDTWQELPLEVSHTVSTQVATYGEPVCHGKQGYLTVSFSGGDLQKSAFGLFQTIDAGRTYRAVTVLKDLVDTSPGQRITSTMSGSTLLTFDAPTKSAIRVTSVPADGPQSRHSAESGRKSIGIRSASFADSLDGWVVTSTGLLATADGGMTWRSITPGGTPGYIPEGKVATAAPIAERSATTNRNAPIPLTTGTATKNTRMGFDISLAPDLSVMQDWWNSSPYYEIGIYPIGSVNRSCKSTGKCADNLNLNLQGSQGPAWVSSVTSQGWGVFPIWVGPQADCYSYKINPKTGKPSPVLKTISKYLVNGMTPYSLGVSQADAAIKASQNLSAQLAAIIYYDMEPYTATAGDACSTEVRQFMQGWVTELKLKGFKAGAYGNVWAAANDYSTLAAAPNSIDDVYVTNPTPTNVSIWSLASGSKKLGTYVALCDPFSVIPCTNWNSQQRIHQYALDTKIIYGSSPELGVDIDLVNADVAVSSTTTAAKPLVYNYFDLEIAGALVTQPTGISDSGAVVGYTASTSGNGFLFSIDQYTLPIDQYTFIGCPGAVETVPWAVNDAGRIVGEYISSSGPVEFIYSKGKCPTIPLQPPAALNDSGLIVGSGGIAQFYIKNQNTGKTSAVPCSRCVVYGIDGDAYIVGTTNPNQTVIPTSFLYDPVAGSFTTFSGPPLFSVNANLQLLSGQALYDYATKTSTPIQYPQAFANESGAAAINDYAEIVGAWTDSTGGTHGFLACPEGDPNCPAQ